MQSSGSQADARGTTVVTGCLQKGAGNDYVLTTINEPSASVGTSGSGSSYTAGASGGSNTAGAGGSSNTAGASANNSVVAREQMRSASHSYRLSGDSKHLDSLLGRQVRVIGSISEQSSLPSTAGSNASSQGTNNSSGTRDNGGQSRPREGQLAEMTVNSITQVADGCGQPGQARTTGELGNTPQSGRTGAGSTTPSGNQSPNSSPRPNDR